LFFSSPHHREALARQEPVKKHPKLELNFFFFCIFFYLFFFKQKNTLIFVLIWNLAAVLWEKF